MWARLCVIFGAILVIGSAATIIGEKLLVATATSGITRTNLLGPAGNQQTQHHVQINGPINILLVGIDERPDQAATDLSRSDSIIVLHVPAGHDAAYLVSIPRDSYVDIPPYPAAGYPGGHDKINAAYAYGSAKGQGRAGGFQLLAQTVKQLTGVNFDAGAIVNFGGFQQLVSALDGVDMCVDEKTISVHIGFDRNGAFAVPYDQSGGQPVPVRGVRPQIYYPGCQHLAAWQALDYVRQRELLPDGDYGRQRHQQQFLKAIFKGALSKGVVSNPGKLSTVISAAGKAVTLDTGGVGLDDWLYTLRGIDASKLVTIKTNGGQFNNETINGTAYEILNDTTLQLLHDVATDTVDQFAAAHPDWVIDSTAKPGTASPGTTASARVTRSY
jgi:LCP family protein required for cell wall assembly